jgi:endoglucanase
MKTSRLTAFALSGLILLNLPAAAMTFKISSIGYHPQGGKVAIVEDVPEGQEPKFVLYDPTRRNPRLPVFLGATVYRIENVRTVENKDRQGPAGKTMILDFSDFQEPGTYEIRVEDSEAKPQPVRITEYLYWDTLKPVVKSFYFQRCGQEVEESAKKIFHGACHLDDAQLLSGTTFYGDDQPDVVGGWHNGGDYAKYVTSTALSSAKMMAMYEWGTKPFRYFRLDYPLTEPGLGGTNDLLHEVKAGLDWLLTMQRRDGAVYRKVAGKQWPGKVSPTDDEQPRFVYGISTQDTANTAAVLAMAARNFKRADLGYSVKTLLAAEKAWEFLNKHPETVVERSDSDFTGSGEFIDPQAASDMSYRLWAAAELYITTGKPVYHQYFLNHLPEVSIQRFSWQNPAMLGLTDYMLYAANKDEGIAAGLKSRLINLADGIAQDVSYGIWPSGLKQYRKSSDQDVTERAVMLMTAYRLTNQARYRDAASRSVAYLFGLNPLGMTYVTGLEGKSVAHPVHRWMQVMDKTIPGFMVDGPNSEANDGKTLKGYGAYSYTDDAAAASVNESTILNNASLAYLLGVLNDAYNTGREPGASDQNLPPGLPSVK